MTFRMIDDTRPPTAPGAGPQPPSAVDADASEAPSCCSTERQASCCDAADKAACCGPAATAGGGCGCSSARA